MPSIQCAKIQKKVNTASVCVYFFVFLQPKMSQEEIIRQTVEALRRGSTILYPTDTIWGIGCDARNADAVERLYAIKERDRAKSMLVLVSSALNVKEFESVERPTTYILPYSVWHDGLRLEMADNLVAADGTLGVRVPRHPFCQEVLRRLGAPLVSTSANLSGRPSPRSYNEIEEELKCRVDWCVPMLPEFLSGENQGSRIVKVSEEGTVTVIRP